MVIQTRLVTAKELERMPSENAHVELVNGQIAQTPLHGWQHGLVLGNIIGVLGQFLQQNKIGTAYVVTGFILSHNPDPVRAPDAAFVSAERAAQQKRREGFFDGAPDLAVEVVSPEDTVEEVDSKVLDYLQAGTRLVWIVHPRTQTITAYRSLDKVRVLTANDTLDGDDVLPGFAVAVKEIFE
jgi:Uma2 family endonuclease